MWRRGGDWRGLWTESGDVCAAAPADAPGGPPGRGPAECRLRRRSIAASALSRGRRRPGGTCPVRRPPRRFVCALSRPGRCPGRTPHLLRPRCAAASARSRRRAGRAAPLPRAPGAPPARPTTCAGRGAKADPSAGAVPVRTPGRCSPAMCSGRAPLRAACRVVARPRSGCGQQAGDLAGAHAGGLLDQLACDRSDLVSSTAVAVFRIPIRLDPGRCTKRQQMAHPVALVLGIAAGSLSRRRG